MLRHINHILMIVIVLLCCLLGTQAFASIVINGTRVIYQGARKEVTVTLTNNNKTPVLIQNWIDTGNESSEPGKTVVPFILTPPINRVDPGKGQTLRISYLGTPALPTNKESVFWLNVLEVPAKSKGLDEEQSRLNIAFRSRIKLFYRPAGLVGDPMKAPQLLKLQSENGRVTAINPTPYHITLTTLTYKSNGKTYDIPGMMVAPGESHSFVFKELKESINLSQLKYSAINDYGGLVEYKASH